MSVRGLVTVVIGVVAFVVIDSLRVIGALWSNLQMKNPLSQGSLSAIAYGNPELAGCCVATGQVQRLYTGYPLQMDKEKVRSIGKPVLHKVSPILLREQTRAALTLWRCKNLPNSGNANL